jgi:hypothetical protein
VAVEILVGIPENLAAISVSAIGKVPTTGWTHPDLAPWMYITPPKDGILDLDFVASPPTGIVLQVLTRISITKAFPIPKWVLGVRVHTSTNHKVAMIGESKKSGENKTFADGMPSPWPFPWWAPNAQI